MTEHEFGWYSHQLAEIQTAARLLRERVGWLENKRFADQLVRETDDNCEALRRHLASLVESA